MREVTITGNLGADAKVQTDRNGNNFLTFRMANHEFGDNENESRWYDVAFFGMPRIASFLKKGTGVRVIGDYKDSIYNNEKYGPQISRNIVAFKIDFWNSGKRSEETQETEQPQASAPEPATPAKPKTPKATTPKTPKPAPTPSAQPVGDDDLPF